MPPSACRSLYLGRVVPKARFIQPELTGRRGGCFGTVSLPLYCLLAGANFQPSALQIESTRQRRPARLGYPKDSASTSRDTCLGKFPTTRNFEDLVQGAIATFQTPQASSLLPRGAPGGGVWDRIPAHSCGAQRAPCAWTGERYLGVR